MESRYIGSKMIRGFEEKNASFDGNERKEERKMIV